MLRCLWLELDVGSERGTNWCSINVNVDNSNEGCDMCDGDESCVCRTYKLLSVMILIMASMMYIMILMMIMIMMKMYVSTLLSQDGIDESKYDIHDDNDGSDDDEDDNDNDEDGDDEDNDGNDDDDDDDDDGNDDDDDDNDDGNDGNDDDDDDNDDDNDEDGDMQWWCWWCGSDDYDDGHLKFLIALHISQLNIMG